LLDPIVIYQQRPTVKAARAIMTVLNRCCIAERASGISRNMELDV